MKPINLLYYALALFAPIFIFTVFTNNTNETHPVYVWLLCPLLYAAAGLLSSMGKLVVENKITYRFKWIGWSVVIGLAEAAILIYAA